MSDRGLGQHVKFESLTGDPCALKASLFWVRISTIYANSETTACGLPSAHSCLPPVCLSIAEERGKRLGGKRIFMAIPQNTSILPPRIMDSAFLPKSDRLERKRHAQWSSSNAVEIRQAARSSAAKRILFAVRLRQTESSAYQIIEELLREQCP